MTDVLVPFGKEFLAMSREQFQEALQRGADLMPGQDTKTAQNDDQSLWLTVQQLAEETGVSKGFWYEEVRCGRIPSHKFGTSVRVPRSFLAEIEAESIGRKE